MKTEKNILIAFILNLLFSVFEFVGGVVTGSVAIISDAVHDIGDAASIGVSYFLERKSKSKPDEIYTYGYMRYSVLGSIITNMILFFGSLMVIYNAVNRILNPVAINYSGMIIFAIIGVLVNLIAAFVTKDGDSLNQKAVNLHMLEDVLGWLVVLIGAIIMKFTDISIIDPIMSIGVAVFILINSVKNLKEVIDLFLEKTPKNVSVKELKERLMKIEGVLNIHHVHIWSMDGYNNYATMHVLTNKNTIEIKKKIREELKAYGICHTTLELEMIGECCKEKKCNVEVKVKSGCCCHRH